MTEEVIYHAMVAGIGALLVAFGPVAAWWGWHRANDPENPIGGLIAIGGLIMIAFGLGMIAVHLPPILIAHLAGHF